MGVLSTIPRGNILQRLGAEDSQIDVERLLQQVRADLHPASWPLLKTNRRRSLGCLLAMALARPGHWLPRPCTLPLPIRASLAA